MKCVEFVHDSIKKRNHTYAMTWSVLDGVGTLADLASNLIMMKTMQPWQLRGKVAQSFSNIDCDLYASIKAWGGHVVPMNMRNPGEHQPVRAVGSVYNTWHTHSRRWREVNSRRRGWLHDRHWLTQEGRLCVILCIVYVVPPLCAWSKKHRTND